MAVIIGGLIVIWLGLGMGGAALRWLGIELHYPARLAAPMLLAVLETVLFLVFVPVPSCCRKLGAGPWPAAWSPPPG